MRLAIQDAKVEPKQIDYVNAHATSTVLGDEVEVKGLRAVFGKRVEKILVNATKSLIGHTLGASGAIATIASTLSLDKNVIHPTLNYTNPDPNCALPGISSKAQKKSLRTALVNAFGFGSNNAVLVLKKFS
jgi:3-oxoacyl-[acyl-carrier-protein] synthase II